MKTPVKSMATVLIAALLSFSAYAQDTQVGDETDPVYLFNEVCYTQVPSVSKIQDMATRFAWVPMEGPNLERFTTIKTPALLEGWDIRLADRIYRLVIVQSEPSDAFMQAYPALDSATATSCTMVLDGQDDAQTIFERMTYMVGKAPTTQEVPDGELLTTTWSGGNDNVKVFVFLKTDAINRANLMNVTIVSVTK